MLNCFALSLPLMPPTGEAPIFPLFLPLAAASFHQHPKGSKAWSHFFTDGDGGALGPEQVWDLPPPLLLFPSSVSAPQDADFSALSKLLWALGELCAGESVRSLRGAVGLTGSHQPAGGLLPSLAVFSSSAVSDPWWPRGPQPARLPCPSLWESQP